LTAGTGTRRATLCASADATGEREQLERWLARWESRLPHVSGNLGCGCCVDLYEVEAPVEALAELPENLFADSEWTGGGSVTFPDRREPSA
jgi:hypothetical protein